MRFILTTVIMTMLTQPVWAFTTYSCFTKAFVGMQYGQFVEQDVEPFEMTVSYDGIEFGAGKFFKSLVMDVDYYSSEEHFHASSESSLAHFKYPHLNFGSVNQGQTVGLDAICHKF